MLHSVMWLSVLKKITLPFGMCKCDYIYACRNITAPHAPLSKKISNLNSILSIYLKPNVIQIRQ